MVHQSLTFGVLQARLIEFVRLGLYNGELTERRLARMIGISQPHMHNILKGIRTLTPEVTDLLLTALGLSPLDLVRTGEVEALLEARQYEAQRSRVAPVLDGCFGPEHPFPKMSGAVGWCHLPHWLSAVRSRLVFGNLGGDPDSPLPAGHDFALLSLDESARLRVSESQVAVLKWKGAAYVRRLQCSGSEVKVLHQYSWLSAEGPETIPIEGQSLLMVVRGVVLWSGKDIRGASPLDYMGSFLENPASR
jgi:plasmid maintenance system antidote protein VapI